MGSFVTCRHRLLAFRHLSPQMGLHIPVPGESSRAIPSSENTAQKRKKDTVRRRIWVGIASQGKNVRRRLGAIQQIFIGLFRGLLSYTVSIRCYREAHDISVIIHYPADKKAQQDLAKRVANVHAQTVIEKVKSMPYPTEQKIKLIDAVKSYIPK